MIEGRSISNSVYPVCITRQLLRRGVSITTTTSPNMVPPNRLATDVEAPGVSRGVAHIQTVYAARRTPP